MLAVVTLLLIALAASVRTLTAFALALVPAIGALLTLVLWLAFRDGDASEEDVLRRWLDTVAHRMPDA